MNFFSILLSAMSYELSAMDHEQCISTRLRAIKLPVLVLREVTERPEALEAGTVRVVGLNKDKIVQETQRLLDDEILYEKMSKAANPYGDGKASKRIVEVLRRVE